MPILNVEVIVAMGESVPREAAAAIADAAGAVMHSPKGRMWVRLRVLPLDHYAENGGGPDPGIRPVFVHVIRASIPPASELEREASSLAAAIATALDRPVENVHVLYEPPAAGRAAFGGKLFRG